MTSRRAPAGASTALAAVLTSCVGLLAGCATSEKAVIAKAPTADAQEVTGRNLASCREQAQAAKMSEANPGFARFIDDCMKKEKGGVVSR